MNSFFYRVFFCEIKSFHYESSSGLIPKELFVHLGGFLSPGELWPGRVLPLLGCPPGRQTMPGAGGGAGWGKAPDVCDTMYLKVFLME